MTELLTEHTVADYLVGRGVLRPGPSQARELTGGVSNVVLLVESDSGRFVVKQALPQLRVADEWFADPARAQSEAEALRLLGSLDPESVPQLVDDDADRFALTMTAAPADWVTWKDDLMAGRIDPSVGAALGSLLRHWHLATDRTTLPAIFEDQELFDQLRLDPFFGVSATRRPELAKTLPELADAIRSRRRTLVLGDYSPKNILVGGEGLWVIDHEVAHRGDPSFDLAFMLCHLAAKSIRRPEDAIALTNTAERFIAGYGDAPGVEDEAHLGRIFAGLLLARVVGASPLGYLTTDQRSIIEQRVTPLIVATPQEFTETWRRVTSP